MHTHTHTHTHTHIYRQRALKALDERLNKTEEPLSWPSLDEGGTSSQEDEQTQGSHTVAQLEAVVVEGNPPGATETEQSKTSSTTSLPTAKTEVV